MKSVWIGRPEQIKNVYAPEVAIALEREAGLETGRIYTGEDIYNIPEAEMIFSTWGMPAVEENRIDDFFPKLKAIFYGAGTVQEFARPFLKKGVRIFSAWYANGVPVAEYTLAQILLAGKNFYACSRYQSEGKLDSAQYARSKISGNYNITVGIIGAGVIGTMVIKLLKNHDVKILVFDPFMPKEKALELGVELCSLEKLFRESLVVSNHLANNAQTAGILRYEHFSLMPETGVFINTGRGAQVVEEDLVKALREREDLTAVLDVTFPEPPEENHPFYQLPNAVLTPHIAGSLGSETARMGEYMLEEYRRYVRGENLKYEVTLEMLKTMA